jgi:hypothetical protein
MTASIFLASAAEMVFASLMGAMPQQTTASDTAPAATHPSLSDPKHLWNRLRFRFHVRVEGEIAHGPDKVAFDPNEHDPLHWSRIWFPKSADYLLQGAPYREALALLDEFLTKEGEKLESDPLKRALLQHDLWAVFDYVSDPQWLHPPHLEPESKRYREERRQLYRRLARAIDRLALTRDEIGQLPDNYAAAVAARKYPPKFDPERPAQAFLPSDLWEAEGPWCLVAEWASNPLAIRHTAFFGGRSTFAVFLRLPEGRAATVKYLKELREWKPKPGQAIPPDGQAIPPQVPPQTQIALARRMLVVNGDGELMPTRLTESVQVRVLPDPAKPGGAAQTFLEFRLRRQSLTDGKGGGLSAVEEHERERSDMLDLGPRHDEEKHVPILASCRNCHTDQGILSMNSYTGRMDNVSGLRGLRSLVESQLEGQEDATLAWKRKQYSWGLLTGFKESKCRD